KIGDQLDHMRHKVLDDKLVIERMEVNDRGLYVCRAENSEGISQGSAVVEIELREIPSIEIFREAAQTVPRGSRCRVSHFNVAPIALILFLQHLLLMPNHWRHPRAQSRMAAQRWKSFYFQCSSIRRTSSLQRGYCSRRR